MQKSWIEPMFESIRDAWSRETGAPGSDPKDGSPGGQCAVTALLVQDVFGGELLRCEIKDDRGTAYGSHYWNRVPGLGEIDLTREQFPPDYPIPRGVVVPRSRLLEGERAVAARTPERYEELKRRYKRGCYMRGW